MRPLPLLLLLLATPALAEDPPAATPAAPSVSAPAVAAPTPAEPPATPAPTSAATEVVTEAVPAPPLPPPAEAPMPRFGLRLGLGVPDGGTADLVFRPQRWLRLQAGPAWNYLGWGVQGGVAFTPIRWAISPVFEVRYGHFFSANLNKTFSVPAEMQPLASDVAYDYFNGQVAFEIGSPRGFTFSLGFGLSYLWTNIHGSATTVQNPGTPDEATVTITDPALRAAVPSVRLGFLYYF